MVSPRLLFFFLALLIFTGNTVAQPDDFVHRECLDKGSYASNSTYEANLNYLLSSLTSNSEIDYGFYNSSHGQNSDSVYAIGLCRGDVNTDTCRSCLHNATSLLPQRCPNQKEAIGWYDGCMLRYSNRSIFGIMETAPSSIILNPNNVSTTYVDQYNDDLRTLFKSLTSQAAAGGSLRKFAANKTTVAQSKPLYAFVQCTPDLSEQLCRDCLLGTLFQDFPRCCDGKEGVRVFKPSCSIRFEVFNFLSSTPDASTPSSPLAPPASPPPSSNNTTTTTTTGRKRNTSRTIIIIVVPTVVLMLVVISICICIKSRKPGKKVESNFVDQIRSMESLQFDFGTMRVATDNFSEANKLGEGGFGVVYKGILSNGQVIAVKRLSTESRQGDLEFKNEVLLVAKLQHRNLVRLLGFCLEMESNERLLVYEFVQNASLDQFLFDPIRGADLDWETRYKIIGGIARGMLYLHEDSRLRIIHRDLKASNILLDGKMDPKISDFGTARMFLSDDQTRENASRVVGTPGYMAPEYRIHKQFSVKSDVFSFGVLVLEIVSGQGIHSFRNGENLEHLPSYAWRSWSEGTASNIVDSRMRSGSTIAIMRCVHIGLLCVQENAADRPTMAAVVVMLNNSSNTLPAPSRPAFFLHSNIELDMSPNQSFQASRNEVSVTDLDAR
ncbi:hypothetical protein I3760_09G079800 [Carya illinoinensis]|nr:hypothetical protein I3760_09G079800 [Carya illinoinensis]